MNNVPDKYARLVRCRLAFECCRPPSGLQPGDCHRCLTVSLFFYRKYVLFKGLLEIKLLDNSGKHVYETPHEKATIVERASTALFLSTGRLWSGAFKV